MSSKTTDPEQLAIERFCYERGLTPREWLVIDEIVRQRYRDLVEADRKEKHDND